MDKTQDQIRLRERRIDEALMESFPASDPPFFVAAGVSRADEGPGTDDPGEPPANVRKRARKKR